MSIIIIRHDDLTYLRYEGGVPGVPVLPRKAHCVDSQLLLTKHLVVKQRISSVFVLHLARLNYIKIGHSPQSDGGHVERVGDEVHDVPHVIDVLLQSHVPQLLDLTPDQS